MSPPAPPSHTSLDADTEMADAVSTDDPLLVVDGLSPQSAAIYLIINHPFAPPSKLSEAIAMRQLTANVYGLMNGNTPLEFVAMFELAGHTVDRLDPYFNVAFKSTQITTPITSLARARAKISARAVTVPSVLSDEEQELYHRVQVNFNSVTKILNICWHELLTQAASKQNYWGWLPGPVDGVMSTAYNPLFVSELLFTNVPKPSDATPVLTRAQMELNPTVSVGSTITADQKRVQRDRFIEQGRLTPPPSTDWPLSHLQDPDQKYEQLASDYDLTGVRVTVPSIYDGNGDLVHPSDYRKYLFAGQKIAVRFTAKIFKFNPPIGHTIIHTLHLLPSSSTALRSFYDHFYANLPNVIFPPRGTKRPQSGVLPSKPTPEKPTKKQKPSEASPEAGPSRPTRKTNSKQNSG
ncbi:hypothetical protein VKT23_018676 [Stygiomarasmius scandens]|uniref:Uncharacterized protein n=1 Tax=Marasmiellus scandens TaxID=2682957 RepID=A0ABR1ISU4_9AGAR